MNIIHSLITVRNLVVAFLMVAVVWVFAMFYTSNETQVSLNETQEQAAQDESTKSVTENPSSFVTDLSRDSIEDDNTPVFVNLNPLTLNSNDYIDPDEMLIQFEEIDIPPEQHGSIGEFIDPDDDGFAFMDLTPGSIGEVVNPDDDSYALDVYSSGSIGRVIDPDDSIIDLKISNSGNIGEVVDPDYRY